MRIAVIGTGYVGLITGVGLAITGHDVTCVDRDKAKIDGLNKGIVPIHENGLEWEMKKNKDKLTFTTDIEKAVLGCDVVFVAVGTPSDERGACDLSAVETVCRQLNEHSHDQRMRVLVMKSTVPVGTHKKVAEWAGEYYYIVSNPEFLREGVAIPDFMCPDRIVLGTNGSPYVNEVMVGVYDWFFDDQNEHIKIIWTDNASAEMIKYASNGMLAARITFMNEIARLCDETGADIKEVEIGVGADRRIGKDFLRAGIGYGGSCFPKDVKELVHMGEKHGRPQHVAHSVTHANSIMPAYMVEKISNTIGDGTIYGLKGKTVLVLGLTFKPNTDDTRDAPAKTIIQYLLNLGVNVRVAEEIDSATEQYYKKFGDKIVYGRVPYNMAQGADAVILCNEWDKFVNLRWDEMYSLMTVEPGVPVIYDGRNCLNPTLMKALGFAYYGIGRS